MSARKTLLLVDPDQKSVRVLEVSLRKLGYAVGTADTAATALQTALTTPPDLVVTETQLPDYDGFELVRRLREDPRTAHSLVVFLTEGATPELKVRGIDVGADEFLAKPVLVKEIISRIRSLLERRDTDGMQSEQGDRLSGTLASMGLVDILQVVEAGDKSGTAQIASDPVRSGGFVESRRERGTLYFDRGRVIDAELGRLRGREAVFRMMLWEDGIFDIEFAPVFREETIEESASDLLLEGLRHVDLWARYTDRLPALQSRLRADMQVASARGALPREVQQVLSAFDGRRTLFEVVARSELPLETTLKIVATLHEQGALIPAEDDGGDDQALATWLSEPVPETPSPESTDLPSALGQAVIPSPASASQILSSLDTGSTDLPPSTPKGTPLLRQTMSASQVGPLPSRLPESAPSPRRPSLRVQRVGSTIESLPALSAMEDGTGPSPGFVDGAERRAGPEALASRGPFGRSTEPEPTSRRPERWPDRRADLESRNGEDPFTPARAGGTVHPTPVDEDPRYVDTRELPRTSESLDDQTAALASAPAAYTPTEASTFRDDFFKDEEAAPPPAYGPPVWVIAGLGVLVVAAIIFVASTMENGSDGDEASPPSDAVTEKAPMTPEERARAAMEADASGGSQDGAEEADGRTDPEISAMKEGSPTAGAEAETSEPPEPEPEPEPEVAQTAKPRPARTEPEPPQEPAPDPQAARRGRSRRLARSGDRALRNGQLDQAESNYRQALELDPRNADAQSGLAFVHMERAEDDEARSLARSALRLDRRQARAHLVLGLIAFNRNDREEARRAYRSYLALAPNGRHAPDVRAALENLQ
ncbi:MAG TPA: response regulator [Myxococcales bacterium LLY-WYZ-16_1]|nr:response regulator [Myxococcales bacterium LLY-WYZ-16_1]